MDFHGITMKGKYFMETQSSLPSWTASDESRVLYNSSDGKMYFGNSSKFLRPLIANADDAPDGDGTRTLGTALLRFATIYTVTLECTTLNATTVNATTVNGQVKYS